MSAIIGGKNHHRSATMEKEKAAVATNEAEALQQPDEAAVAPVEQAYCRCFFELLASWCRSEAASCCSAW